METEASTDAETARARQDFRIKMIKLSRYAERQANPETAVDLSNVPPHLIHRYT